MQDFNTGGNQEQQENKADENRQGAPGQNRAANDGFEAFRRQVTNTRDETGGFDPADIEKNKVLCAISYLWILFFLPLAACPGSRFGRFHANQALTLFIVEAAGNIVLALIPTFIGDLAGALFNLACLGLLLFGLVNTLNGRAKRLPFIGGAELIK